MCTCINFKTKDFYFGRNLDLEYNFGEKVIITPRKYKFELKNKNSFQTKYAMIGMATVIDSYPLYADAVNEKGLCIAGLYFPGNAVYYKEKESYLNIASFELIPWCLGNYSNIAELRKDLEKINITNQAFSENMPNAELHWMISDEKECIVLEQTKYGLQIYDNPYGVLTNNPPFYYHDMNMNNYMNVSAKFPTNTFSEEIDLKPYGQGMGMMGLPGDVTPTSRFVRTAFYKINSITDEDEESSISQFFHILDSVSMIKGSVITKENNYDMTTYSSCMNASKGIYYFKTYYNNQINAVSLNEKNKNEENLEIYELPKNQNIQYLN